MRVWVTRPVPPFVGSALFQTAHSDQTKSEQNMCGAVECLVVTIGFAPEIA